MHLYLIRHGDAEDVELAKQRGVPDADRSLTEKGIKRNEKIALWLLDNEININRIISSPYRRAQETATQLRDFLFPLESEERYKKQKKRDANELIEVRKELLPSAPPQAILEVLKQQNKNIDGTLIVGHEPHLSLLASWLLAGSSQSFIHLKKSGCLCLRIENINELKAHGAILEWHIHPKYF